MLEITPEAYPHLEKMVSGAQLDSALRIAIMGSTAGSGLGIILDQVSEDDLLVRQGELPFIINRQLAKYCVKIQIDYRAGSGGSCGSSSSGFVITPQQPINF